MSENDHSLIQMLKPNGRRRRPRLQHYRAYLLRLWQVESDGHLVWWASLEDPHSGEKQGFADLALLYKFLAEQTLTDSHEPGTKT